MSTDRPPNETVLWVKYMFNGEAREVNIAQADIVRIIHTGPGMFNVFYDNGVVDAIVSGEMITRIKVDQVKQVITPDKEIALVS